MDIDTADLKTTRKNLIAMSILIIFYFASEATLGNKDNGSISLFGNTLWIPENRMIWVWAVALAIHTWLLWRHDVLATRNPFEIGDYILQSGKVQGLIHLAMATFPHQSFVIANDALKGVRSTGEIPPFYDGKVVLITSRTYRLQQSELEAIGITDENRESIYICFDASRKEAAPIGFENNNNEPGYITQPFLNWASKRPIVYELSAPGVNDLQELMISRGLKKAAPSNTNLTSSWVNDERRVFIGLDNVSIFYEITRNTDMMADLTIPWLLPTAAWFILLWIGVSGLLF